MREWRAVALLSVAVGSAAPASSLANAISDENTQAGTREWEITSPAARGDLEAYASAPSVARGEPVAIHARSSFAAAVTWEVFRLGWYGGAGARRVASGGPVPVGPQPVPAPDAHGLLECGWPVTFTVATDPGWTSGYHLVRLTRSDGEQTWATFVLRADDRRGVAVVQAAVSTWQAYDDFGGSGLYAGSQEVSFDRPYVQDHGAGELLRWEAFLAWWLEARGYDVTYLADVDLDRDPSLLEGQRLFVSVGHDEYWSRPRRDAVEAALARGVALAFLGSNTCYWQVRLEPGRRSGAPRQTLVGYKERAALDPLYPGPLTTGHWRDPPLDRPENALVGVQYTAWHLVDLPLVVAGASSWLWTGSGARDGDLVAGVVGYETDRTVGNALSPPGLEVVGRSPAVHAGGAPALHEAAAYRAPSGALVFASGTMGWVWGLSRPGFVDARVQGATANVLAAAGLEPATPGAVGPAPAGVPGGAPQTPAAAEAGASPRVVAARVTTLAGAGEGFTDGPAARARFHGPLGLAADAAGALYVADTGNHAVRVLSPDGAVSTVAGSGEPGTADGDARRAVLRLPQGVAVGADGAVYVSDSGNNRVVRLVRGADGAVTLATLAGSRAGEGGDADGPGLDARFSLPTGIAAVGGDLYLADTFNSRLRRIAPDGTVTTVVGSAGPGFADGDGATARVYRPTGLVVRGSELWVVDTGNRALRRVTLAPRVSVATVAGGPEGGFGDGPIATARLEPLGAPALGDAGLLFADAGSARVRRLDGGAVTTHAGGSASGTADGDGRTATFVLPTALALLPGGRVAVADAGASTIRVLEGTEEVAAAPPAPSSPASAPPSGAAPAGAAPPPAAQGAPPGGGEAGAAPRRQGSCSTGDAGAAALVVALWALLRLRPRPLRSRPEGHRDAR